MTNETTERRGRKKISNDLKKIPVTIYLPQIEVDKLGGKELLKTNLLLILKHTINATDNN